MVDSGNKTELNHYLKLAGINASVTEVTDYGITIEGKGGTQG